VDRYGGGIAPTDREVFTYGSCYLLAEEIHERTGWPLCAFWDDEIKDYVDHCFVLTPAGTFLDVDGEHDPDEFKDDWDREAIALLPDDFDLSDWGDENPYIKEGNDRKAAVAEALIEQWEVNTDADSRRIRLGNSVKPRAMALRRWIPEAGRVHGR
jgi:hypothetical protein